MTADPAVPSPHPRSRLEGAGEPVVGSEAQLRDIWGGCGGPSHVIFPSLKIGMDLAERVVSRCQRAPPLHQHV